MADLSEIQSSQSVKIAGATPATGAENNYMDVDTTGRITVKLNDSGGSAITNGQTTMVNSVPVTIASNQSTLNVGHLDISASGSITAFDAVSTSLVGANSQTFYFGTPTAGSVVSFAITSINTVSVEATLLGVCGPMYIEVSMDGGTLWVRPNVFQPSTQNYINGYTSNFVAIVNVAGMTNLRVRGITSWTGNATITVKETINTQVINISDALPPGANVIGGVTQSGTWNVNNVSGTVSLPTGASTAANQTTEISALQLIDNPIGSVAAGTAGTSSFLGGGVFNTSLPTLTNTQQTAIQLDSSGRQIIAPLANTSVIKVQLQDNAGTAIVLDNSQLLVQDVINTSGQNRAQSVTTSAAEALGAATILTNRKYISILPTNGTIYWGYTSGVTTVIGTPIFKNQLMTIAATDNVHIYVIAATTIDVRITEGA